LGHASIRTTALYWQNIHGDNDTEDILAGKKWLEGKGKTPTEPLITENFPQKAKTPEPIIIEKPVISKTKLIIKENPPPYKDRIKPVIDYQPKKLISQISPKTLENFSLNNNPTIINEQLPLTTSQEQPSDKEKFLLEKIKNLEEQLKQKHEETKYLKNQTRFLKGQNIILKTEKEKAEAIATTEKQRANNYEKQLNHITENIKKATQQFYQLQKQEHYKELEQECQELEAKIIQSPPSKKCPN
jgi:hypothetical protein